MDTFPSFPPERQLTLNRTTGGAFSPAMYLNIIQEGTEEEWGVLYRACLSNPSTKQAVARQLPMGDPLLREYVWLWADMLGVCRPALSVEESAAV
jgi:hypothetical protein